MFNRIVWFDLPVKDLGRAIRFYTEVLGAALTVAHPGVAVFAHGGEEVSGCLIEQRDGNGARADGALLYFNVAGRMEAAVAAVEALGGRIEQAPQPIGAFGRRAIVIDSEGNRIALHSP
jgi:predicted enzyme related to lactoylglutathione lyase